MDQGAQIDVVDQLLWQIQALHHAQTKLRNPGGMSAGDGIAMVECREHGLDGIHEHLAAMTAIRLHLKEPGRRDGQCGGGLRARDVNTFVPAEQAVLCLRSCAQRDSHAMLFASADHDEHAIATRRGLDKFRR